MTTLQVNARPYFHGTPHDFVDFDPATLGKGTDQLGSGFYFTDRVETAEGYAGSEGFVFEARLAIANPLPVDRKFTASEIERMMRASPFFLDRLTDWGEVDFEGERVVVGRAVSTYVQMSEGADDAVAVLNAISNDMWPGHEADFLAAVIEATGHDGLVRETSDVETHAVAWSFSQIGIVAKTATVPAPAL